MKLINGTFLLLGFVAIAGLSGCSNAEKPSMQYMPHMATTPNLKSQRGYEGNGNGASVMVPPEGTLPRGFTRYTYETPEEADRALRNPLKMTRYNVEHGQKLYGIYCMVCHGERGHGDGPVVNPFPIPKSLQSDNMLRWGDGHLFHVITKGQGVMPAYATQIAAKDRWAIVLYVRALQRADHPTAEDLKEFRKISN